MKLPEKFTEQSLVEYVIPLLVAQRTQSIYSNETRFRYKYNGPKGKHCAIGFIIPPELYKSTWEGECIDRIYIMIPSIKDLDPDFLNDLQALHDFIPMLNEPSIEVFNRIKFKKKVQQYCNKYGLLDAFLEELEWIE